MTGDYLLEKLLESFQNSYDVERTCDINGDICDAYASFQAASARELPLRAPSQESRSFCWQMSPPARWIPNPASR